MIYPSNFNENIQNWCSKPGREILYEYYQGTEPESGGQKNLKRAIYIENSYVRFVINYEWNDGNIKRQYYSKK